MIKRLIKDLTYDNITLTEGLNRAKIIAFEINNTKFKDWINFELNGYKTDSIPHYRKIKVDVVADIQNPFHGKRTIPYDLSAWDEHLQVMIYKMNVLQSVPTMETNIKNTEKAAHAVMFEYLPINLVQTFKKMTIDGDDIVSIRRKFQVSQVLHILEITKQKLVDTLLELNQNFPNLEDDYHNNKENAKIADTIVNNIINGETNNSNVNFGQDVKQVLTIKRDKQIDSLLKFIAELNLDKTELKEVQTLVEKNKEDKNFGKKMLTWAGNIATKAVEKGIELKIPELFERIQEIL